MHRSRSASPPPLEPLQCRMGSTLPSVLTLPLEAIKTYAVRGSGAIHTSLEDALADFKAAAAKGPATLHTTDNPQVATYVAAGHTLEEVKALFGVHYSGEGLILKEYAYDSDNEYWQDP